MDSTKPTSLISRGLTFFRIFKSSSATFWIYDDILLKLYIEVAKTGDFKKLVKKGKANEVECLQAWENLVKKQEKETGSNHFNTFLLLLKGYASLLNDHTVLRACLIHLMFAPVYWEVLSTLEAKGYSIKVNSDGRADIQSVQAALRRVENLITKATMKQKELEKMFQGKEEKGDSKGFEQIRANLEFALGFTVDENITLARYNEYQRILKAKQKAIEEANGRNKRK